MKRLIAILIFISTLFCQSKDTDTISDNETLQYYRYYGSSGLHFYNVDRINRELENANFPHLENKCITLGFHLGFRFKDTSGREGMVKWFKNHTYSLFSIKTSFTPDELRSSSMNYVNFDCITIGYDFLINFPITDNLTFYLFPGISYTWSEVTIGRSESDYFTLEEYLNSPSEIYEITKNYPSFSVGAGFDFKIPYENWYGSKFDFLVGIAIKMNIFEFSIPLDRENASKNKIGVIIENFSPDLTNAFSIEIKIGAEHFLD